MLIITDPTAVTAAFESKTPRPFRELMLEIYPDATEDCNGRFHAPYDGYECTLTGNSYKAGEFLPANGIDDQDSFTVGRPIWHPIAVDLEGKEWKWHGTKAQNRAAWSEIVSQARAFDRLTSQHLGAVGDKIKLELKISYIHVYPGFYANVHIHIMHDKARNVVIYKGAKRLGEKGSTIKVVAKVKLHGEREGVKQTTIERPKVLTS